MLAGRILVLIPSRLTVILGVEGNPNPYPDLNTWHQCRDVEVVHDWAMKKQSNNGIDRVKGVVKASGVKELKADP